MKNIILAPFSNSDIRDWPAEHYGALIGCLLDRVEHDRTICVVGTASQRLRANDVVRPHPADRVFNDCGRLSWAALVEELKGAGCVIGNNSGIAHLSGSFGVPTVCVFGGSHQRAEWRPLGDNVILVSRAIGCSPCQLDHNSQSPYDRACLRLIEPAVVADAVMLAMARKTDRAIRQIAGVQQAGF
ncbi:glycosyltransferase family 9 protein [Sphingomonas sp. BIUV-7]|uniref:Glycosyltransferase family 9 protein n=1 Tax=Sphingomonas natans TaxID=3063330 RepID=A0ABT8Y5R6_9SPHN|nr:glycosyltransferase family 9 protein [Sphingomonas sp. BIUV-7]MDO6413665.1 glycosyltransferase family 9 protein [Sphingomonas sp. BIUV-7]